MDRLLTPEAASQPSDATEPEKLVFELPPWYDKEKFDRLVLKLLDAYVRVVGNNCIPAPCTHVQRLKLSYWQSFSEMSIDAVGTQTFPSLGRHCQKYTS